MIRIRFKLRIFLLVVVLAGVVLALATKWHRAAMRQYDAMSQLMSKRDTGYAEFDYSNFSYLPDYKVALNESGQYVLREPFPQSPSGIDRLLTCFFDERLVCNATCVNFRHTPNDADILLVRSLKGVKQITIGTTDEGILTRWRMAFPNAEVESFGHELVWEALDKE